MNYWRIRGFVVMISLAVAGCAASPAAAPGGQTAGQAPSAPQPTIIFASRGEPSTLAAKGFGATTGNFRAVSMFNAGLTFKDEHDQAQPHLAQTIPQLNTGAWTVSPDGKMTTTFKLRPNLTWHDGEPLTADDFVFSYQVYSTPELGVSGTTPIKQVESINALDPLTVVINWRRLYADAVTENGGFYPLPRHVLEQPFQTQDPAAFQGNSFWVLEYVGAGPFKEVEYVPGDHIDTAPFAGYALGRPKIEKLRIIFIADPQAAVAQLLAGTVQFADSFAINPTDGVNLEQQWASNKEGEILWSPTDPREALVQWRPEYALPVGIRDQRVRKALAYSFDNQGAIDGLNFGKGILTNTATVPGVAGYDQIEKVIEPYRYDPRKAGQLMTDAGYTKGSDGFFADGTSKRFEIDVWSSSGEKNIQEATFVVDGLKRAGIFANQQIFSVQQLNDGMARATVPGLSIRGGNAYEYYLTADIASPVNRWSGNNRSGYSNPDYDRFYDEWTNTLDPAKRIQALANLERVLNQDVGVIMMYLQDTPTARIAALKGPANTDHQGAGGGILRIYTWTWEP